MLERLSQKLIGKRRRTVIEKALALQRRAEMRTDGLEQDSRHFRNAPGALRQLRTMRNAHLIQMLEIPRKLVRRSVAMGRFPLRSTADDLLQLSCEGKAPPW